MPEDPAHLTGGLVGSAGPPPAQPVGPARIVLADDNADMRGYVSKLLGAHWQVDLAADGQEALRLARAHVPDLVITDVMMPHLDGFGLLRELRADHGTRRIPVMMLSARGR